MSQPASSTSGKIVLLVLGIAIAVVAVSGFLLLRQASDRRFAVSIHTVPESRYPDVIPLGQPVLVRIEKHSAGRSPLLAFAILLDGDGHPVNAELTPLATRQLTPRRRIEEVVFPPLTTIPSQRLLASIVLRLPSAEVATARENVAAILQQPAPKGLPQVFSRILARSRELGGHAELTQIEVRTTLDPKSD